MKLFELLTPFLDMCAIHIQVTYTLHHKIPEKFVFYSGTWSLVRQTSLLCFIFLEEEVKI